MDNQAAGAELSQLARLLLDTAASRWYRAIGLEVLAGVGSVVLGLVTLPATWALLGAIGGVILLGVAYVLRLGFEDQYDAAETMRRQSVLTEALGWPLDPAQLREWKQKAGKKIRARAKAEPRAPDYYATQQPSGPRRLAEMTLESAFYTRQQYIRLRALIWVVFVVAVASSFLLFSVALVTTLPADIGPQIARAVYTLIPVVISINLLGWALRLTRLISAIWDVERGLDSILEQPTPDERQALRLVAEYNCQVVNGFPIHNRLFQRWRDEIGNLWHDR